MRTMMSAVVLALAGASAQAQTLTQYYAIEMQAGAVFIEYLVGVQADVCPARDPAARKAWADALPAWKLRNREELAAMGRLEEQLRAHDPVSTVALQAHATVMVLHWIASLNDGNAARACGDLLKNLSNPQADAKLFADAKAATAAILAKPR